MVKEPNYKVMSRDKTGVY